jgi:hypothetical protein
VYRIYVIRNGRFVPGYDPSGPGCDLDYLVRLCTAAGHTRVADYIYLTRGGNFWFIA